tara:strand:+ start:880 stop:1038 length:159 start_codon:yes stop_codon:yes gene_type:complete
MVLMGAFQYARGFDGKARGDFRGTVNVGFFREEESVCVWAARFPLFVNPCAF